VADGLKEEAAMTTLEPRATPGMSYLAEGDMEWEAGSSHRPGTPDGVTFMVVRSLAPGERDRIAGH
jgi:hypothetical protein